MAIDNKKLKEKRPAFEPWLSYLLFVFIGFTVADLLILSYRDLMLPNQTPPAHPKKTINDNLVSRGALNTIISRNIFSADGLIPNALIPKGQDPNKMDEMAPVLSQLPLNLIGTLVSSNPEKSIAAIEIRGKNQTLSYTPKRNIENLATLLKVERQKVILRNLNSNALEFIEMKPYGNQKVAFGAMTPVAGGSGEVKNLGDNKFTIKRADLQKYLNDLPSILMQARAVPARDKVTGEVIGYRIVDFQPNSIFSQLGIQRMDLIKTVNGEPVDTPQKAMELFNMFKNSNNIKMSVDRGGRNETLDYSIQ